MHNTEIFLSKLSCNKYEITSDYSFQIQKKSPWPNKILGYLKDLTRQTMNEVIKDEC